jgi:hypothetical protein
MNSKQIKTRNYLYIECRCKNKKKISFFYQDLKGKYENSLISSLLIIFNEL